MKNQNIKIYSSDSIYKQGLLKIFKKMVKNVVECKELAWQLFVRDFKAKYKQSLLGVLWVFIMPVVTMATFLVLNISGIIKIGDIPVPYPIFGLLGISLWNIFANGWSILTGSVVGAGSLISQINFPKEALFISVMGQIIVDFLIRLILVLIIYLFYGIFPSILFLLLPLYVLPIFLLALGLGMLTSLLNVVIRDVQNFINLGMNFFLFLMPIMYTMPEKGILAIVNKYNPIYFLISTPRDIIISGTIKYPLEFLFSSTLALIIFLTGWLVFYISQEKIAERI